MALKILNEGLDRYPRDYNLRASVISALQMKKEYDRAYDLTQELIKLEPENEWNNYNLGLCYYNRRVKDRNYDKVISFMENIKNDEILVNGGCYAVLSFSYYQKKDYEKSKEYYIKFFTTNCVEEFIIKNKKEIKRFYKKLIKKFPDDPKLKEIGNKHPDFLSYK
jgi:tetratricopeptide (TPR) repeat protein